jgi:antitoxin HicB
VANTGDRPIVRKKRTLQIGSRFDDVVRAEGIFAALQIQSIKEVIAWQLEQSMEKKHISKARLAKLLRTSRTQVSRLLDPECDVTLSSLQRAAALIGRQVRLELV